MNRCKPTFALVLTFLFSFVSLPLLADDDYKEKNQDFVHGIVVKVDGERYYLAGAPDGPNGEFDIPGHSWVQLTKNKLIGKHFNTGPFGTPQWWSSTADDGALLYTVAGVIDTWSMVKAATYYNKGFIHYHELISVEDGSLHPDKVLWLRHAATTHFNLDGGPAPELGHEVSPGIDFLFPPNWATPYNPAP